MKIYVVGNISVEKDSLPLRILPQLCKKFPDIEFVEIDPSENFTPPLGKPLYIIDTVVGISDAAVFSNLDSFLSHKLISSHDYDLYFHLRLLKKINRSPAEVHIIGIPVDFDKDSSLSAVLGFVEEIRLRGRKLKDAHR